MNFSRIIERKYVKERAINEGMFNIRYITDRAKKELDYYNTLNFIDENQGRVPFNTVLEIVRDTISKEDIQECEIKRIKSSLCKSMSYYNNMRNLKIVTERFMNKYNCDLKCVIDEADTMVSVDRILKNEAQLNKKFGMDKFLKNYNIFSEDSAISLVEELCFMIDSCFKCNNDLKFNVAMENVSFALYEKGSLLDEETILETISRYFDLYGADVNKIISESAVVNEKVKMTVLNRLKDKSVSKVKELIQKIKEIKTPQQVKSVIRVLYSQSPQQVLDDIPNFLTWIRTFIMFSTVAINPYLGCIIMLVDQFIGLTVKQQEADKMISKFEREKEKCEKKLDKLKSDKARENLEEYINTLDKSIDKLESYRDSLHGEKEDYSMYEMTQEQKDMFDLLNEGEHGYTPFTMSKQCFREKYFAEATKQFNIVKECVNTFSKPSVIKENIVLQENEFDKYPLSYLSENGNIYVPLMNISENMSDSSKKSLINNIKRKVNDNYRLVEESAEKGTVLNLYSEYAIKTTNDPIHVSVMEAYDAVTNIEKSLKTYIESCNNINENAIDYMKSAEIDDVLSITKLSTFSEAFDKTDMHNVLRERINEMYENNARSIDIHHMNNAIKSLQEKYEINSSNIEDLSEAFSALTDITEGSALGNNLLIAREKLRKSAQKLSDKDKEISNRIDNQLGNLIEKTQRSLTNRNREAVIKGSILPSASAAIKLGLASIATIPINPLLSIIILVGGLGASKIGTMKEKQYIMDEIEIELKLVDKKIQLAERNDDTKALEKLYRIEKQLQREKTRILYNKKNYRPIEKDR